jgi:hypothetical protein
MDQEAAYVGVTRSREGSWVYGVISDFADWPHGMNRAEAESRALVGLAAAFSRSRPDELSVVAVERANLALDPYPAEPEDWAEWQANDFVYESARYSTLER